MNFVVLFNRQTKQTKKGHTFSVMSIPHINIKIQLNRFFNKERPPPVLCSNIF